MNSASLLLNFPVVAGWIAQSEKHRYYASAAAAVLLASVAYGFILKTGLFGDQAVTAIDDFGEAVAAAIACAACAWAASRAAGRERLGWTLLGISTGLWSAGELAWSYYEVIRQVTVPYPGLPDVGFLGAVPFAMAGIRAFWSEAARGTSVHWRVWFDAVIVSIALTSTAWAFGLREVWQSDSSTKLLDLAYPVGDILVGTMLILAIRRASNQAAGRMALLLAGIACYSIADSAFAYLNAHGSYASVGSVLNTGWFLGFLMIALAAVYPGQASVQSARSGRLDLWQLALPWMTLLLASAGDVYSSLTGGGIDVFMSSMTALLAILLTVNMIIERREFLEMMNEIEDSRSTLNEDFRAMLVRLEAQSQQIAVADKNEDTEVRRLAADIQRDVERLEHLVEEML